MKIISLEFTILLLHTMTTTIVQGCGLLEKMLTKNLSK